MTSTLTYTGEIEDFWALATVSSTAWTIQSYTSTAGNQVITLVSAQDNTCDAGIQGYRVDYNHDAVVPAPELNSVTMGFHAETIDDNPDATQPLNHLTMSGTVAALDREGQYGPVTGPRNHTDDSCSSAHGSRTVRTTHPKTPRKVFATRGLLHC